MGDELPSGFPLAPPLAATGGLLTYYHYDRVSKQKEAAQRFTAVLTNKQDNGKDVLETCANRTTTVQNFFCDDVILT